MSGISYCSVTSRRPSRNPGLGGISLWKGSTMTPASSSWYRSMMADVVSMSLKGAISISSWMDRGIPAESGFAFGNSGGSVGPMLIKA